ncbi:MAG: hypothetical protein ACR2KM_05795 [Gemmatimonadaceae bacterium]
MRAVGPARVHGQRWVDVIVALVFALIAALGSYAGMRRLTTVVRAPEMSDVWFDGDIPRVSTTITDRWSEKHQRARVHPLFPLITVPAYAARAFGVSPRTVVTGFTLIVAFLWPIALFALLRAIGLARTDAAVFTALGLTSGAAVFWLAVPESFGLGSVTIMLGLLPAALGRSRHVRDRWYVVASACSLSITTTNWSAGLFATAVKHRWRGTIWISAVALAVVAALARLQRVFVPMAGFFIGGVGSEQQFVFRPDAERIAVVLRAMFIHSMVIPNLVTIARVPVCAGALSASAGSTALSLQQASGVTTVWGTVAVCGWIVLLAIALVSAYQHRRNDRFLWAVLLFLLAQIALHLVYGKETFLYAMDYLPAVIIFAAFGAVGKFRRAALVFAIGVAVVAGVNNVLQFTTASKFVAAEALRSALVCSPVSGVGHAQDARRPTTSRG